MCNDLCLRGRVCPGGPGYNYLQGRSSIAKAEQYGKAWCNVGRGRRWRCDRRELGPAECGDIHSNYSSSRQDPVVVVVVVVVAGENGERRRGGPAGARLWVSCNVSVSEGETRCYDKIGQERARAVGEDSYDRVNNDQGVGQSHVGVCTPK